MKRTIRWSILMAILGFILGLGFLVPMPAEEARVPASDQGSSESKLLFRALDLEAGRDTVNQPESTFPSLNVPTTKPATPSPTARVDRRKDVLFDLHTISESSYANNTDAYVVAWFKNDETRDEIESLTYCHNYDYEAHRARTELDRYAVRSEDPKKAFPCYPVSLERLRRGTDLIDTPFGPVISLKSGNNFDAHQGGTVSIIFAHKVRPIGYNDYRVATIRISLQNKSLKVSGPYGIDHETASDFRWLNLTMSQNAVGFPNGVAAISFFNQGKFGRKYPGHLFLETPRP